MEISIPVTLHPDDKGYIDRECPNEECQYTFKVLLKDWKEKVSDEEVHCPLCGYVGSSDSWWTQNQLRMIENIAAKWAMNYVQKELDKSFSKLAQSTRNNKFIQITYNPGRRISFFNNPIGQREEWETEICCEQCGTHYSVIGSAFFCPCCGYNSVVNSYNDSLNSIERMIESLQEVKALLTEKYNADSAETMCRSMLEGSIGDLISAFQKFASCKYGELSGKQSRPNDFQIVEKGSQLFEREIGKSYLNWLSSDELDFMKVMFQRRHLLEHNNGMIDEKYLEKTNDQNYVVGQRLIVKVSDVFELLTILRKLGNELIKIQKGDLSNGD